MAWSTKSVGALVIKILDRNDGVVYSVNNDNVYKNVGFVMNYPAGKYRFKIESANNPNVYAYSPYFFINDPGDTTPPSAPSNIQIYHNSGDANNLIGFRLTLPADNDYRSVRIYKSKISGQLGNELGVSCSFINNKPGETVTCYPYTELEASGTMYYTIKAEDTNFNQSTNTAQYPFVFAISVLQSAPILSSPANNSNISSTTTIVLYFSSVSGATQYQFKIYDFSGRELQSSNLSGGSIVNNVVSGGSFLGDGSYQWKARACNDVPSDSTCGPWSTTWSFVKGSPSSGASTITSMKVISPNGGEKWEAGKTYNISWQSTGDIKGVIIYLANTNNAILATNLVNTSGNPGAVSWTIPSHITPDNYKILIVGCSAVNCAVGDTVSSATEIAKDLSDASFSVTAATLDALTKPSITVLSPNGGEVFKVGDNVQIKWKSQGVADKAGIYISDSRIYGSGSTNYISFPSMDSLSVPVEQGYYNWKIPSLSVLPGRGDGKNYKISVSINSSVNDTSDAPFSILPSSSTVPAIPAVPTSVSGTSTVLAIPAMPVYASLQEGSLIKTPGSPDVYVIKNGQKVRIQSPQEFEQNGYKWDQIKEVQAELLAQIAELKAQIKQLKEELKMAGALIKKIGSPEVYVVTESGAKEHIKSAEEFAKKGYKWNQIQEISAEELAQIPDVGSLSSPSAPTAVLSSAIQNLKPGSLVKSPDSPTIYYITKTGTKKPILNPEVFNSYEGNRWENVKVISQEQIWQYPEAMTVKLSGGSRIYFIKNGKKQWVKTPVAFEKMKLQWDKVEVVNKTEMDAYQEGEAIE